MIKAKPNPRRREHKTRYVGYVVATVDGRISLTRKSRPDWTSPEDWRFFQGELAKADAIVVGRNTYESVKSQLRKRATYVLSTRLKTTREKGSVIFVNPARVDVRKLLARHRTVAVVGGARVYQWMLDKGLLDELYVTIEPLVFGRGKEMFSGGTKTKHLRLVSVRKLNRRGTLLLRYVVK